MNTRVKRGAGQVHLIYEDVPEKYHDVLRHLAYSPTEEGFIKSYSEDLPTVEAAVQNFPRHAVDMLLQAAGEQPVLWEQTLLMLIERVAGANLDWWLCGSAALAVRGLAVQPHDVDLVVMGDGAPALAEIMRDDLLEPFVPVENWVTDWFGRSFLDCRLEWIGNPDPIVDANGPSDFGPIAVSRLETVQWRGHALRVPPLDLQLTTSRSRGLHQRAELIEAALKQGI